MVSNPKSTVNSANDAKLAYKWNNMYKEKLNAPASVNSPSDAIVASENGTVEDIHDIKKYGNGSFGNYVLVSYGDYLAIYAHLNSEPSHLNIGQKINAGDLQEIPVIQETLLVFISISRTPCTVCEDVKDSGGNITCKKVTFSVESYMEAYWYIQAGFALADQGFTDEVEDETSA